MIKRTLRLCVGLAAVCAYSAIAIASASAAEENKNGLLLKLPTGSSFPASFTSTTAGETLIETKSFSLRCQTANDNGMFENAHLGKDTVIFGGCGTTILGIKVKCFNVGASSAEETAGVITAHLLTHLGRITVGGVEKDGVLTLLEGGSLTFHCSGASTVVLKGEIISLIETPGKTEIVAGTEYESMLQKFTRVGAGEQAETTFFLLLLPKPTTESGEMTGVHLTLALNGGAEEAASLESAVTFSNLKNSKGERIKSDFERG